MENKYYTPELDEFCAGFRYEVNNKMVDGKLLLLEEWIKKIFGDDSTYDLRFMQFLIDYKYYIRVKYLDKEDIKSLGFYLEEQTVDLILFKSKKYNFIELHLKYDKITILSNGRTIFEGIVKNKSELNRLLKQLEI